MQTLLKISSLLGVIVALNGCATKTIVIDSQSDIVRLGNDVRGHVYYYKDGQWQKSGRVTLPEGWFAGSMNPK
jgi:hypothetical protein